MKQNIALWVFLFIIIIAFGWWAYSHTSVLKIPFQQTEISSTTPPVIATTSPSVPSVTPRHTTQNKPVQNTYHSLITVQENYECQYNQVTDSNQISDVIYVANGKLRGEFRATNSPGNIVVYDGINLYAWKEGSAAGTKTQPKTIADLPSIIPRDFTSSSVLGSGLNSVSWSCHPWIKEPALLTPPTQVKFSL